MPMTAVPQRTAMSHAFGALAAALVGTAEFYQRQPSTPTTGFVMVALVIETLLGFLTFTGSLMAFGKLQEILPTRPITYKNQNADQLRAVRDRGRRWACALILVPTDTWLFPIFAGLSLLFGVLLIIPIGGADMPTVIALLNSYAGPLGLRHGIRAGQQAADHRRRAGRLVRPDPLDHHVQGHEPLVHQRAVRRLRAGADGARRRPSSARTARASAEEAASILEAARSVIIVPGYGMAVAQAQHKIRELYDIADASAAST